MLEMQEDKSIKKSDPQSQEINTGWQKYTFEKLINSTSSVERKWH